ncbi:MAG: hypothetical protein IJ165_10295 [Proteobacteria bacterium]|nr:hypothetical protein [Pseudomonadota bacterium]
MRCRQPFFEDVHMTPLEHKENESVCDPNYDNTDKDSPYSAASSHDQHGLSSSILFYARQTFLAHILAKNENKNVGDACFVRKRRAFERLCGLVQGEVSPCAAISRHAVPRGKPLGLQCREIRRYPLCQGAAGG